MTLLLPALRYCAVASIVLVLVLAVTAVSLNLSAARPVYAWAASQALNRDVQIAGPVSLRLGTVTTLSMNGITIAGTTDTTPVFARIDSAVAQFAPIPLLQGALHFTALTVADVSLFIDIDEQGQGNWPAAIDENVTPADGSQERPAYQLRATEVSLERVHAQIQSAGNKRHDAISIEALTQTLVADNLQLIARGTLNRSPYEVTLAGEGIHSLLDVQDWKIEMQGTVGDAQFQLSTAIPSLEQIMRSKVDASVRADSANAILQALDLPSINDGPVDLAVSARHSDDRQRIKLDAKFGDLQLAGTADHALATAWESVRLAVNAHGTSLSHLGALWNKPNLPETSFDIDLAASLEGSELNVETLQLSSEAITLSLTGRLPAYRSLGTGNLSGTIDVPALGAFGNLLDLPSELQGALHGTLLLTRDPTGTDVLVTSHSAMLTLELIGRLTPEGTLSGSNFRFSGVSAQPDQWLGLLMDAPPELPSFDFAGEASLLTPKTIALDNLVVHMGGDTVSAEGVLGWATAQQETTISLTARSRNLRATLNPWVPSPQMIPELATSATAQISYLSANAFQIDQARVWSAEGKLQFEGKVSLENSNPEISGVVAVSASTLQPFVPQFIVPERYERPLSLSGNIAWEPDAIAIDISDKGLSYGSIIAGGQVSVDLINQEGRFDVLASTPDVRDYLPDDKRDPNQTKMPMNVRATGEWNEATLRAEALRVESAEIQIAAAGLLELSSEKFTNSHLDADINITRLTALSEWLDFSFPDQGLALTADIDSQGGALVISALTLRSGDSDLAVRGRIARSPDAQMKLDVTSNRINLDPWTAAMREENGTEAEGGKSVPGDQPVLPDYRIRTAWFDDFSADANLRIAELIGLPRPVFNVRGALTTDENGLRIDHLSAENERGGGATLRGSLLRSAGATLQLDVSIEGFDLVMGIPKAPSEEIDSLPSYEFKTQVGGAGATTRELASSLDGYLTAVMGSGKVLNVGFDRLTNSFLQELSQVLNPLQSEKDNTTINCAAAFVTIESGKLVGKPAIVVDTPDVKISSNITLDLGSERIKAKFKTVPQKGLGFSVSSVFNPYVEVTGTLAKPQITVDPANTVVGGSLAVMTGGLSILAQNVADRMSSSGNICAERLSKAQEEISTRSGQN